MLSGTGARYNLPSVLDNPFNLLIGMKKKNFPLSTPCGGHCRMKITASRGGKGETVSSTRLLSKVAAPIGLNLGIPPNTGAPLFGDVFRGFSKYLA